MPMNMALSVSTFRGRYGSQMNDKLLLFGPGYGDPSIVIDQLAKRFDTGFDRLVLSYVDRGTRQPIETSAGDLYPMLSILRKSYKWIGYIGHSMGGLIGRELMRLEPGLFDAYVSIGTPHGGTRLASMAPQWLFKSLSPAVQAMAPGSTFLAKLDATEVTCPAMTVAAQFDELVFPGKAARLPREENHVVIPWTTHVTVALSQRTFYEIWGWLNYEVLGIVNPGDKPGLLTRLS